MCYVKNIRFLKKCFQESCPIEKKFVSLRREIARRWAAPPLHPKLENTMSKIEELQKLREREDHVDTKICKADKTNRKYTYRNIKDCKQKSI